MRRSAMSTSFRLVTAKPIRPYRYRATIKTFIRSKSVIRELTDRHSTQIVGWQNAIYPHEAGSSEHRGAPMTGAGDRAGTAVFEDAFVDLIAAVAGRWR